MTQIILSENSAALSSVVTTECGKPDGSPVDVTTHEVFFDQAKVSLAKWPSTENLDFWMDAAVEAFYGDHVRMHSVLEVIHMNRGNRSGV